MKVTVDINVLLDVFQKREPHYAASARVLAMVQQGEVTGAFTHSPVPAITPVEFLSQFAPS